MNAIHFFPELLDTSVLLISLGMMNFGRIVILLLPTSAVNDFFFIYWF